MLKKMVFLGTGGTIAGTSAQADDNVGYTAAQVGVGQLLQAIPRLQHALGAHAFVAEQVVQVDSKDMGWEQWRMLVQRLHHHLSQPDVGAVVVTHGTDTLEETAFFLSQVLPRQMLDHKAVVMTCAMRPATSLTPDGPQNVLDAVAVAQSAQARGVLAVCAGTVHAARNVQKVHPYRLDAFDSGDAGPLGYVEEGHVRWLHACPVRDAQVGEFPLDALSQQQWPRVEMVTSYAGASAATVRALCATPTGAADQAVRGLVVAGTGNGTIHHELEQALHAVQAAGVRVLRASRCAYGSVVVGSAAGAIQDSGGMTPLKARISLMLDLMRT